MLQCQGPFAPLLLHLLLLLSSCVLPCGQAALQRACARSRELYLLPRSTRRGSGAPHPLSCCAAAQQDVYSSSLCIRE